MLGPDRRKGRRLEGRRPRLGSSGLPAGAAAGEDRGHAIVHREFRLCMGLFLNNRWLDGNRAERRDLGRRDFVAVSALIRQSISGMVPPQTRVTPCRRRLPPAARIVWQSVITVLSAAVLISAEVFGAAFAGGWALANLMGFGDYRRLRPPGRSSSLGGVAVMVAFVRNGMRVEPFTARDSATKFVSRGAVLPRRDSANDFRIFLSDRRARRAKLLHGILKSLICNLPNFARACGRVSIGGHPDKRPDSRPERDRDDRKVIGSLELRTLDWQPEAKPAHLVLHEGRGLKQRRSGLFWSLPVLHRPARATEEACFSLPRVRIGDLPNPIQGSSYGS